VVTSVTILLCCQRQTNEILVVCRETEVNVVLLLSDLLTLSFSFIIFVTLVSFLCCNSVAF